MTKTPIKHKLFKVTIFLVLLILTLNAYAVDWSTVIKNKDANIAVDMDSYDESLGFPSIISRTKFIKPQTIELNTKNVSYITQRAMPQFNCSTHQIKTPVIDMFDKQGKKVASDASKNQFTPVTVGSIDAQLEGLVCQVHKMVGGM